MAWLRWHEGTVNDPKFMVVSRKSGQPVGFVLAVWAMILERASSADERGSISGFDCESADAVMGMPDGAACAIVQAMQDKGLINDDFVCRWSERQPARERGDEAPSTDRVRKHRERQKENRNANLDNETPCNAMEHHETPRGEERRREENLNTPPSPPQAGGGATGDDSPPISDPADVDIGFHEFMAAYPAEHRAPEAEAAGVWKKLAREKKLPGLPRLFQGLDEWEGCEQWKKQGGEFIPKAANFLRRMMWQDRPPVRSTSAPKARAPTPYQQNMADKDALAQALLAERNGEKSNESNDFTEVIDIEHRVRNTAQPIAVGSAG